MLRKVELTYTWGLFLSSGLTDRRSLGLPHFDTFYLLFERSVSSLGFSLLWRVYMFDDMLFAVIRAGTWHKRSFFATQVFSEAALVDKNL